jgi:hypothetical protein
MCGLSHAKASDSSGSAIKQGPLSPVQLARNFGFRAHELREIQSVVTENSEEFLEAWNEFFGIVGT